MNKNLVILFCLIPVYLLTNNCSDKHYELTKIQNGILFVYRPGVKEIKTWRQPDLGLIDKQYSVTTIAPKE